MSRSLDAIAKKQLFPTQYPNNLRNVLHGVFRDPARGSKEIGARKWLRIVKNVVSAGPERARWEVVVGYDAVVSNALILIYLLNSGPETKKLISALVIDEERREGNDSCQIKRCLGLIASFRESRYLEYAVLGVIPERIDRIVESLLDPSFDVLKNFLSSPFEGEGLSIIGRHYGQSIPWFEYRASYEEAVRNFERGELDACVAVLETLIADSVVRIPIAESLLKQAKSKLVEHKELRAILGKI